MSHPNYKSQVRLQQTLPPPGRVRPLAARRSKWDQQKAPIREHSTTATAVTLPISHKGEGLRWRSGRRHAQSQGNGLPRESRNGDAPLLWASQQKTCVAQSP
ncbi:hypothetical protein TcCL_NonESM02988 [Trypanosoma cruzi]|nr:hypothetical protein TcCL_NonESM02988 [Trypanosoma cruzi]